MKRSLILVVVATLTLGLVTGCGDDGPSDAEVKRAYIAKGNAICEKGNAELAQAPEFDPTDDAAFSGFVTDTLIPNVQGQIDQLRKGIPEPDEDGVNGILDDAEAVLGTLEDDPMSLQGETDPFAEINDRLDTYGLTSCADSE